MIKKYLFPKEQMESEEYNREFYRNYKEILQWKQLRIKNMKLLGRKKEEESGEEEFFKKIENYFKGNS